MKTIIATIAIATSLSVQGKPPMDDHLSPDEAREAAAESVLSSTAKVLAVSREDVSLDRPFSAQGSSADDLAFIEIVMAVEEDLGVSIDDSALQRVSGAPGAESVHEYLSVRQLQDFVASLPIPRGFEKGPPPVQEGPEDPLAVGDVGSFEQLAIRPNPEGHVIVTVPDVESLIVALAQERGRSLSEQELREVRASATSLVMSKSDAAKLNALRAERSTQ